MSATPIDRAQLAELLQSYGDDLESFDKLRADSYEQALAAYSLESLASFYAIIHEPGLTVAQAAAKCPTWPLGTKRERQRPSATAIQCVQERMRTRAVISRISPVGQFLKEFRKELKATPLGDNQMLLDGICGALGQKLMADLREGKPIEENLKLIDKLQNQRVIEQNEVRLKQNAEKLSQNDRRIKLLEEREAKQRETLSNEALTPEEKESRMKEILGM